MKTIKIKSLRLINFKGIRSLSLNDLSEETYIYGDNGVGKTTIFDAFTWLLFGKDSTDRKVFEVKTLDDNNNVIPKIEHSVEALLEVDGIPIELKRILREKWVTRRGSTETEFKGNDTVYEWNGVPMNAGDYTSKINTIIDEKIFKLITNPSSFNSLPWKDQRHILIDMSNKVDDFELLGIISNSENQKEVKKLQELFINNKDADSDKLLDGEKKRIKASISKSKQELKEIPSRIDEVERSKPEFLDFKKLKIDLEVKNKAIESVNDQVSDKLKAQQADLDKQKEIQSKIHTIESEVSNTKHKLHQQASESYNIAQSKPREIQRKIDVVDADIKANETTISNNKSRISSYTNQISDIDKSIKNLRAQWEDENAKEFVMDEKDCACPTCKRPFEASDIEDKRKDLEDHFISNKNALLKSITERGQNLSGQKISLQNNVSELERTADEKHKENIRLWEQRAELSDELKKVSVEKTQEQFYNELHKEKESFFITKQKEILELETTLKSRPKVDTSELKSQLDTLNTERDNIKRELQKEEHIDQANKRIDELQKEESVLSQAVADQEKEMHIIEAFEKEKITRIENSVNQKFQKVNFKLFETQINGGEIPTCKALIDGVPYSDANTASRINAGLDIINTLCQHYNANAPIFIDNRESVVELIPTESQLINLIVSDDDKKLRVSDKAQTYSEWVFENKLETQTV